MGDLPTYQSRREYVTNLYRNLESELKGEPVFSSSEPINSPTGWNKVDRVIDRIMDQLSNAKFEEEYQTVGFLCRECLISLAQEVFKAELHVVNGEETPSDTDANKMLEAYFKAEYAGPRNEVLRRHAKAALSLANELQHKRTADYRDAALCSEATRTVVNIVVITTGNR